MSRGINKAVLIGHLGADPEVRPLPSGESVANLSLAHQRALDRQGLRRSRERTEWHRVVLFGRLAEIAAQYLHTGSRVYIEGKLRTRQYQTQDGAERRVTEILVDVAGALQMLDSRPEANTPPAQAPNARRRPATHRTPGRTGGVTRPDTGPGGPGPGLRGGGHSVLRSGVRPSRHLRHAVRLQPPEGLVAPHRGTAPRFPEAP
ncbi:MAG: single-stranded DNA-binding protein [Desulfomicrobium escambiense]|nr:single-stranded DNA-binding protein [Desulfomicrobium escambiense]